MEAILGAILKFTPSARDPDCPPKLDYQVLVLPGSRVKLREVWLQLHTGPPPQPQD